MLALDAVNEVVRKAAAAALKRQAGVKCIVAEPTLDSDGHEALHITVVLTAGSAEKVGGDDALTTLVRIEKALRDANEERLPIVDFVTEEELQASADTES